MNTKTYFEEARAELQALTGDPDVSDRDVLAFIHPDEHGSSTSRSQGRLNLSGEEIKKLERRQFNIGWWRGRKARGEEDF